MGPRTRLFITTLRSVARKPSKLVGYVSAGGLRRLMYVLRMPAHGAWERLRDEEWAVRRYASYDDYVRHQASKLELDFDFGRYDARLQRDVAARTSDLELEGKSVLCLAARLGGEVRGFLDNAAFAVGIDLNPGPDNPHVLKGDFHQLQFADSSVDIVFTNSLDHSLYLDKLLAEVRRVMHSSGLFIVEAMDGAEEFDDWAAVTWGSLDDLVDAICEQGFELTDRRRIETPWLGNHLRFALRRE